MGSAIAAWFAKEGVGLILGALAKLILDGWNEYRSDQAFKQAGRMEAQVEQGNATIEAQKRELEAQANAPKTADDAVARLEEGSA